MARYLQFVARSCCVGAIIVIVAIISRQVYLRNAAEAGTVGADQEPATKMLIRYETMRNRLHNRHSSADTADADEPPRVLKTVFRHSTSVLQLKGKPQDSERDTVKLTLTIIREELRRIVPHREADDPHLHTSMGLSCARTGPRLGASANGSRKPHSARIA